MNVTRPVPSRRDMLAATWLGLPLGETFGFYLETLEDGRVHARWRTIRLPFLESRVHSTVYSTVESNPDSPSGRLWTCEIVLDADDSVALLDHLDRTTHP